MSKCPYQHNMGKEKLMIPTEEVVDTTSGETSVVSYANKDADILKVNTVCPFKNKSEFIKENQEGDDDGEMQSIGGGCPVMKLPKELNTDFAFAYEIPFFHKNDFYFNIRGTCTDADFLEKSQKMRAMPRHKKHTLFYLKDVTFTQKTHPHAVCVITPSQREMLSCA